VSALLASVTPRCIKASHRRRRRIASGHFVQRYYDQSVGRFLSVDPVAARQSGDNFNRYAYVANNPYKFIDPDGRELGAAFRAISKNETGTVSGTSISQEQAGMIVDFMPGFGDAKGFSDAFKNPSFSNVAAAVVGLAGPVGDAAGKVIKNADNIVDAGNGIAAANRAENIAKGVPASQLGPSGKPKIHTVDHGGKRGEAKEAARREVGKGGSTVNHVSPKVGGDHYHGTTPSGEKSRVHHEYKR
jgi:RHS repeat-associated protein